MSESELAAERTAFDIFISYASLDKTAADAVCATLEASGIRCWIAPRDILPGADWSAAIVEALGQCRLLVLVFSANANQSTQIRNEVVLAVHNGLAIVPFRIEATAPTKSLAYFIGAVHWLDALTPPLEAHLQTLATTVRTLLGAPRHEPRAEGLGVKTGPTAAPGFRAVSKPAWRAARWPIAAVVAALAVGASGAAYWAATERHPANNRRAILAFNLPTEQDVSRIRDVAALHGLILPELAFRAPAGAVDPDALRFIGVWSSEIGYNGTGRQAMLIVASVSADRRAEGFVLNGPPTARVYDSNVGPTTIPFSGEIDGEVLAVKPENAKLTYTARLSLQGDALTLAAIRPDGRPASIMLKPLWRLATN